MGIATKCCAEEDTPKSVIFTSEVIVLEAKAPDICMDKLGGVAGVKIIQQISYISVNFAIKVIVLCALLKMHMLSTFMTLMDPKDVIRSI